MPPVSSSRTPWEKSYVVPKSKVVVSAQTYSSTMLIYVKWVLTPVEQFSLAKTPPKTLPNVLTHIQIIWWPISNRQ